VVTINTRFDDTDPGSTHYIGHIPVDVYTDAKLPDSNVEKLLIQA
jgi:hypothetical protein